MNGFLAELKRRNVFRVGIAYAAAAWLLIQVADTLVPIIGLPDSVPRVVLVLLAIGFPVVLVLAWIYELTPEGLVADDRSPRSNSTALFDRRLDFIIIGLLAIAVAYLVLSRYALESPSGHADTGKRLSIAVLPFVNASDEANNEYFAEGMSDEIRNLLGQVDSLKVIGRTSSHAFKDKAADVRAIAEALGVATLLEGSVRKSGNRVRIATQLISAADGAELWSDTYDRVVIDVFEVQEAVAADIVDALRIHVGAPPSRGRPTDNPDAYTLFLQAKAAINALDYARAPALLEEATRIDPGFAEAFEALAYAYWLSTGTRQAVESQRLVSEAANRAIELNPELAFARIYARSANLGPDYRTGTVAALDRAVLEYPDDTRLLEALVFYRTQMGYLDEAVHTARHFVEIDPLSLIPHSYLALALYSVGDVEAAMAASRFVLESEPVLTPDTWALVGMLLMEHRDEIAVDFVESALESRGDAGPDWFRAVVDHARDPSNGQAYLDRQIPEVVRIMSGQHSLLWEEEVLGLYLYFGYLDRYYDSVFATEPTDRTWHYSGVHAWRGVIFRRHGFTGHPGYLNLMQLLGVDKVWNQRGAPDYCSRSGSGWSCD